MKRRFSKILSVALTLSLVLTMAAAFTPTALAAPDADKWSKVTFPDEGSNGDYFMSGQPVDDGPGPMAMAIDGTLFCYWDPGTGLGNNTNMFKSTDGGRTWDDVGGSTDPLASADCIVDIECSDIDADIVYATDGTKIYKTANEGRNWVTLSSSPASLATCSTSPMPSVYVQVFIEGKDLKEPMHFGYLIILS